MRTKFLCAAIAMATVFAGSVVCAETPQQKAMANRIAAGLKQSGQLKNYKVGVKYQDGVAWLTGSVTSPQQKQTAQQLAQQMQGVSHVVNRLDIAATAPPAQTGYAGRNMQAQGRPAPHMASRQPNRIQQTSMRPRMNNQRSSQPQQRMQQRRNNMPQNNTPRPMPNQPQRFSGGVPLPMPGQSPIRQISAQTPSASPAQYCGPACGPGGGAYGGAGGPMGYAGGGGGAGASMDQSNMPGYAWPSYAASSNYAALTYPKQYSASAWPYIGPFYPYPQVPLGWRKVCLEWDDGWWFLDFSDTNTH